MRDPDWFYEDEDYEFNDYLANRAEELYSIPNAEPDEDGLIDCPVLPLREMIIYPRMVSPLFIARHNSIMAAHDAVESEGTVISLTQIDPDVDNPAPKDLYGIGVELALGRLMTMPDGSSSTIVQGRRRVEVVEYYRNGPLLFARARPIPENNNYTSETEALMRAVIDLFEKCVELNHQIPEDAFEFALNIDDPSWLADMVASTIAPSQNERREVLLELDPNMRLKLVSGMLARELDVLQLESEIHSRVQSEVDRSQREMYLREQMKAIQTELGEGDIWTQDINDLRTRIENTSLPPEVMARATKEITRLSQLPSMSPEVGIIRAYIEWIVDLPWEANTEDNLDVSNAAKVLDEHHYGLKRPKERVLEFIAVRSLRPKKSRQPILCFAGPPGTGKTSLGRSIAKALGRKFIRMSLGGVRDEAEIRGHRRTYIGALPGRILQTMKRAGTNNPLIMLDEVDKLSSDSRGDPSSALLEVLDPEQNHQFSDHYLEVPYDLSKVMFITTANWTGRIPDPLLDRMEVIDFTGYIEEEKLEIARQFLIPRQVEENGLESNEINFSDSVIQRLIREYTYEAGVRNLEREIGRICRKIARLKAEKKRHPVRIVPSMLERFLGPPQFFETEAEREDEVGVATALVWTFNGGDINPIEVLLLEGKGNLQLTGQLGDVMQESAQAALSFVKSRADKLSIPFEQFDETDIHVHLPEGAIPKDGPSAGITLATAIISAFTDRKVRKDVGMTGEITLRGRVLPIGGLREKVLAAHRSGLNTIIIPQRNEKDLVDLPRKVKSALKIIPVAHMDEVIDNALLPAKKRTTRRKSKTKESDTD